MSDYRNYRNYTVVPTIDLTTKEDGTVRMYHVRELSRPFSEALVSATSKAEAKEIARQAPNYLDGKLSANIQE